MSTSATLAVPAVQDMRRYRAMKWLARRPAAIIASLVVTLFVAGALAAPWLAPFDPNTPHFDAIRKPPSEIYRLGTDEVGRDVLSRVPPCWRASSRSPSRSRSASRSGSCRGMPADGWMA